MSTPNKPKTIGRALAAILLAVMLIISCVVSFVAIVPLGKNHAALDAAAANAQWQLQRYESNSTRMQSKFADSMFNKAIAASLAYTEGADLEKIANTLLLKSINITDEDGVITAAYPEDLLGKKLKEMDDTIALNPLAKNIVLKKMGKIVPQYNGKTLVYVGAARVDLPEGKTGAVVVTLTTTDYDAAYGAEVADSCGKNTIVEKDGAALSSNFADAQGKTISELTKQTDGKPFKLSLNGKNYDAKVVTEGELTALVTVEPVSGSITAFLIIAVADIVLIALGCAAMFLPGKKKDA